MHILEFPFCYIIIQSRFFDYYYYYLSELFSLTNSFRLIWMTLYRKFISKWFLHFKWNLWINIFSCTYHISIDDANHILSLALSLSSPFYCHASDERSEKSKIDDIFFWLNEFWIEIEFHFNFYCTLALYLIMI